MSANYPPPQQPAPGQNPYGQPPQSPYGAPPQPGFNGAAYPPPAPIAPQRPDNVALGLLVGVAATLVMALAYGGLLRLMSKNDGTFYEFRLIAIAVGLVIGLVVGKVGGRNPLLPVAAIVFALAAIILGELFGGALIISHYASTHGGELSTTDILFHHFGDLWDAWKHDFDFKRVLFLVFGGLVAFGLAKRFGEN